MSETATVQPAAEMSLADAMDAGINSLDTPSIEQSKQETPKTVTPAIEKQEVKLESNIDNSKVSNDPLNILTKRMSGQDEPEKISSEEPEIKTPENLKPEAQTAWARLTKDLRDARAKIKELETKSSQTPQNTVEQADLKAQLESLRLERDEYENELRFARLESTKEYKTAVTEPLSVIQKEVADIAGLYETDPRNIYAAMVEPDSAKRRALLKEATSSFDPVDSLSIRQKAEDLQKVFQKRELLTKDVQTVLNMIENDEKIERETFQRQSQEELTNAYKTEWELIQKENPLLRPIQDNEAWNNTLQSIEKQALDIENTELDPRSKARLTFNAAAMPVVMNVFKDYVTKTQARINELEKTAKELRATIPSSGGTTGSSEEISSDLGFLDALERGLNKK